MAKLTVNKLSKFFEESPDFLILLKPNKAISSSPLNTVTIGYLNLIRPKAIHVIDKDESAYINSLSEVEQKELIDLLLKNGAVFFIFIRPTLPMQSFLSRDDVFLIDTALDLDQIRNCVNSLLSDSLKNSIALHGSFVIIYNQGILITGESGVGKSTLLLSLLNRQHMWVADDSPAFTLNDKNEIIGHAAQRLESFVHIKNVGIINMDNEYGRSKQLKQHKLSAIVHLKHSSDCREENSCEFDPLTSEEVLGIGIPKWTLGNRSEDLSLLIEKCAHQLVLHSWGIFDAKQFDKKLIHLLD